MTHGKRREFAKAERVLAHIASLDPEYRDVSEKLTALSGARISEETTDGAAEEVEKPNPDVTSSSGHQLGRYKLERTLGRGAMATVYLGIDPKINRKVAIKTIALAEEFSDTDLDAAKTQFRREAESAGQDPFTMANHGQVRITRLWMGLNMPIYLMQKSGLQMEIIMKPSPWPME